MIEILYLIRHGHTGFNAKNLFRGDSDVPLTDEGRDDAEKAAEFLGGIEPSFIINSDRLRAVETSQILSKYFGIEQHCTPQLRAWDVGDFAGKPRNKENLAAIQKYIDDPCLVVPGGEALSEFTARAMPAIEEGFQLANCHGVGFVVVHSSIIHELGNQLHGDHTSLVVEPGGIVVVGVSEDGHPEAKPIFKKFNAPKNAETIS